MITIISHFFLFLFLSFFNGKIFLNTFNYNKLKLNFFEISIFGIIITSFIAQIINFFSSLNDYVIIFNLLIISIFFFLKKIKLDFSLNKFDPLNIILFLLVILQIYGSGFSDDLNHYHYSYIKNTDSFNYIIGLGHLHHNFANSSIWLIAHSYFNFNYSSLQDIHVLNALILYLFFSTFLNEIKNNISKKKYNFLPFILLIFIFVLLKYTRLKEFGIDRPSFLIMYFIIYFYFKNFFCNNYDEFIDKKIIFIAYLSVFIFFIKITYFFIGLVPIYLILRYRRFKILKSIEILPLYFIVLSFFIKNILISGCLIYPIPYTCVKLLSWNIKETAEKWYLMGEILNKAWWKYEGDLDELTYISNFNWLKTWFYSIKIELLEFSLTAFMATILTIFSFKKIRIKLEKDEIIQSNIMFKIFFLIFLISFSVFIFKLPVIRMSHYLFILISILFLMKFYSKFKFEYNKFLFIAVFLAITFNGYKNLLRIYDYNFENNPLKTIELIKGKQIERKLGEFIYYTGWFGNYPAGNTVLNETSYAHKKKFIFNIIYKVR